MSTYDTVTQLPIPEIATPKIIFFDIDDTLRRVGIIDTHNQATLEALAKTDLHHVISTDRSKTIQHDDTFALLDNHILDAIICMNGQYSFDRDQVISHYPLSDEQVNTIATLCQQSELIYKFDSATHIAWSGENDLLREFNARTPNSIVDPVYYQTTPVYQGSVFFNNQQDKMQEIDFAQYGLKLVHWHQIGADILPINASKARGIKDVCAHYSIDVSDCMAFGDGMNDLEMFDLVGFAVAMGDAKPELKARADMVTGTIEAYGIQSVLEPLYIDTTTSHR